MLFCKLSGTHVSGTLYIVATPIGNLEDISSRAVKILSSVDAIAAEDTRRTRQLLSHLGVRTPCFALHEHNEAQKTDSVIEQLVRGDAIAVVSDAGTPLLSDPGFRLVSAAHEHGLTVCPIPGPSAVTAALSAAGLPTDRFCFEGFLPAKKAARVARLGELSSETRTLVFFESVHRVQKCIADLCDTFGGDRPAFIAREITKLHEQNVRATLKEIDGKLGTDEIPGKGEFVIVVQGAASAPESSLNEQLLLRELKGALPLRKAAAVAAKVLGGRRNDLYERLMEMDE